MARGAPEGQPRSRAGVRIVGTLLGLFWFLAVAVALVSRQPIPAALGLVAAAIFAVSVRLLGPDLEDLANASYARATDPLRRRGAERAASRIRSRIDTWRLTRYHLGNPQAATVYLLGELFKVIGLLLLVLILNSVFAFYLLYPGVTNPLPSPVEWLVHAEQVLEAVVRLVAVVLNGLLILVAFNTTAEAAFHVGRTTALPSAAIGSRFEDYTKRTVSEVAGMVKKAPDLEPALKADVSRFLEEAAAALKEAQERRGETP
jgi:hypothetical protein